MASKRRAELVGGIKAELPIALGVIPFGLIYGVLALAAGIPPALGQAMSAVVFAGSAQFIGTQLIAQGVAIPFLWLTILMVNLRHLLYSASLAPHVRHLSRPWKGLLAYLLTDEAYVVAVLHYNDRRVPSIHKHWYFLGAGITLWASWQLSTAAGIFLGAQIPSSLSLDFTLALTFIGMLVPTLTTRPMLAAAAVAGPLAVLSAGLPYSLNLLLAALAGIAVGSALDRHKLMA